MTLAVQCNGREYQLHIANGSYELTGAANASGKLSIAQIGPGVYSILDGTRSITVRVAKRSNGVELWADERRFLATLEDMRDRGAADSRSQATGVVELRCSMPGKIVKVLVRAGDPVKAGQGLIVVEAMKMQNEMKAPRDGIVKTVRCSEGATADANDLLMVVE